MTLLSKLNKAFRELGIGLGIVLATLSYSDCKQNKIDVASHQLYHKEWDCDRFYNKAKNAWKLMKDYYFYIQKASQEIGLDENLIKAIIAQESGGELLATSFAGASGPAQLMPATARKLGVPINSHVDLRYDPLSIPLAMKYLKNELNKCKGDLRCALKAYSGGAKNYFENVTCLKEIYDKYSFDVPSIKEQPFANRMLYTVKKGDCLYKIAKKFNITLQELFYLNPGLKYKYKRNPKFLQSGMKLFVPGRSNPINDHNQIIRLFSQVNLVQSNQRPQNIRQINNEPTNKSTNFIKQQKNLQNKNTTTTPNNTTKNKKDRKEKKQEMSVEDIIMRSDEEDKIEAYIQDAEFYIDY